MTGAGAAEGRRLRAGAACAVHAGGGRPRLNDMAGDGPKSWKSRLEAAGFGVRCHMRGLGALPEVQALYGARLREIV
ncbi:MAG: sirohydrochlorin cobaltochelatase [Ruthenibacterium lactatiformans]